RVVPGARDGDWRTVVTDQGGGGMATTTGTAAELIPEGPTLDRLRFAAADCKACDLWARATQTVFGEGQETASVMLIGEQPGDAEDVAGKTFVAPAVERLSSARL